MTLQQAIQSRRSVRKYTDRPIEKHLLDILQHKVDEINTAGNLHIQLVTDEPRAFRGRMAYGTFSGVNNYFVMIGKKANDLPERIGYYGEQLVLLAQTLGLNTCWVGLTYNNIKQAYDKRRNEKLCCIIALGYGNDTPRRLKRKTFRDVSTVLTGTPPEWFRRGVEAALLAPTAVNQQRFNFIYLGADNDGIHHVRAERRFSLIGYTRIDLGIAKLHFEIGAGSAHFEWT